MRRNLQEIIEYIKIPADQIIIVLPETLSLLLDPLNTATGIDFAMIEIAGVSTDTRSIENNQLFVPLIGENYDGHDFRNRAYEKGSVVTMWDKSKEVPNISGIYLLVDDTLAALQSLAHEYRQSLSVKVIAITGSNGKTSTKDFIASVLGQSYNVSQTKGNLNNHIGVPLTLLSIQEEDDYAVIELGMNHFGEINLLTKIANPDYGVITNVGESHIQNFGVKENIGIAKFELFYAMKSGVAIVNWDDLIINQLTNKLLNEKEMKVLKYGLVSNDLDISADLLANVESVVSDIVFKIRKRGNLEDIKFSIKTPGIHNVYNALAAITIGLLTEMPLHDIQAGLATVEITSMRMEIIRHGNSYIINDAYNASPTSMRAAISFLSNLKEPYKKIALLSDMKELGEKSVTYHKQVSQFISRKSIDMILAYGEEASYYLSYILESDTTHVREAIYFPIGKENQLKEIIENELEKGCILLLKGSRSMMLERFININTSGCSEEAE